MNADQKLEYSKLMLKLLKSKEGDPLHIKFPKKVFCQLLLSGKHI